MERLPVIGPPSLLFGRTTAEEQDCFASSCDLADISVKSRQLTPHEVVFPAATPMHAILGT